MKQTLIAAAIVLASTAVANAATSTPSTTPSGRYLWQGDMFITAATSQCSSEGKDVGKIFQAVFEPKGLPANDPNQDKLMIFPFGQLSAMQWVSNTPSTSGLLNGATSISGTGIDSGGLYSNTHPVSSFKVSPEKPTAPKAGTFSAVTITFRKTDASGCTFTASGNLTGPF